MYPQKTKHPGIILRSKKSIQIIMQFGGKKETETLTLIHNAGNINECYSKKLEAERGFKNKNLNYAQIFPNSEKRFKYISYAGDSLTICQRLTMHYNEVDKRHSGGKIAHSTKTSYHWEINRLSRYFTEFYPDMRLSELRPTHLSDWATSRNVIQKSITEELKHIRAIIKYAIGKDHIEKSILAYWSPEAVDKVVIGSDDKGNEIYKQKHEKFPFTKDEIKKILASALIIAPRQYSFILISFALGLRPGEVIGLQWKRYNEIKNEIHILEAVVMGKLKLTPKTPAGERRLELNQAAKKAIEIQKGLTYNDGGFIFTNPRAINKDKFWSTLSLSRMWAKILIHAGVEHRSAYNTRHSYATQLIDAGTSIRDVSRLLGHRDIRITLATYVGGKDEGTLKSSGVDSFISV